ncbi:hypothetical protein D3C75_900080 [compost metagenome]
MEAGAADHLMKIAENEMATIPISISSVTGTGGFFAFTIRFLSGVYKTHTTTA